MSALVSNLRYLIVSTARDVLVDKGSTLQFILKRINEEKDRINTIAALDVLSKCVIGLNYCEKAMKELLNVTFDSEACLDG
jgi:hypothetical protein